jgi:YHS domain-containing protein
MRSAIAAIVMLAAGSAWAGPQYVDRSGFAASGYDVVAFFDKQQAAVGAAQPAPTPGRAEIAATHNGATFAFASEANRARFLADPDRYAPQFDGHCAWAAARGYKAPGDPQQWRIVDGRLYLNYDRGVTRRWERDIPGFIDRGHATWPGIDAEPASTDQAPQLPRGAAPL